MPNSLFKNVGVALKHIRKRWQMLTGSQATFSLQARVFHSITLGSVLLAIGYIPYNLYAGLYVAAASCLLVCLFFLYEYYRSRFLGRRYRSFLFGLFGLLLLPANYFANAGIDGSTDFIWPVFLLLLLTICPNRYQVRWVLVYLLVFGLVHIAEYLYPGLVRFPFRKGEGQFMDRITAFPMPVIGIAIVIGLLRRNYDRERAKVEQRDAEKSRLLSILSHDFRAPLINIRQYLELLNDPALSPEDRTKLEATLREANDNTLDMVTNLLHWSRSQLDGAAVHLMPLSLADTLSSTLAIQRGPAAQKGVVIEQHIDPAINVMGDADMLQLVVRNLLQNAIKFTPQGGTIKVGADITTASCQLYVSDNGAGIPADQLATLFSGNTMPAYGTANEKGVGLGLMLCREFMERQGGSIRVESTPGQGSSFTVELPLVPGSMVHFSEAEIASFQTNIA